MLSNHFVKLYMYMKLYKNTGMINHIIVSTKFKGDPALTISQPILLQYSDNIAVLYIFSSERWNWMTKKT